jgi:hypothetical protein
MKMASLPWAMAVAIGVAAGCGGSGPDPRYPPHEAGCPVKSYPGTPGVAVDELGVVEVECGSARGGCERAAFDRVCALGGDVAWGLADNALTSTKVVVHAAHTRRAMEAERKAGCNVQVFVDAPPMATENIGVVTALCSLDDSREDCLRELQDQVCKVGGNVAWQIEGPSPEATSNGDKQRMRARAAHTK